MLLSNTGAERLTRAFAVCDRVTDLRAFGVELEASDAVKSPQVEPASPRHADAVENELRLEVNLQHNDNGSASAVIIAIGSSRNVAWIRHNYLEMIPYFQNIL